MNTFLAIILGLTVSADLRPHTELYQGIGDLDTNAQLVRDLTPIRISKDQSVKVEAHGGGRGDLDCYLLRHNPNGSGWVVASKDESNMDQCSLSYLPTDDKGLRLWVVNHGVHMTHYTVHVEQ
jgi:hypothetical protein